MGVPLMNGAVFAWFWIVVLCLMFGGLAVVAFFCL